MLALNHSGETCPAAIFYPNFVIIDVTGIHLVNISFCKCYQAGLPCPRREQLLRHRLFPATLKEPRAAFTFEFLNTFHLLTLQSKIAAYDFYRATEQKTDNVGVKDLPVSISLYLLLTPIELLMCRTITSVFLTSYESIATSCLPNDQGVVTIQRASGQHSQGNVPLTVQRALILVSICRMIGLALSRNAGKPTL